MDAQICIMKSSYPTRQGNSAGWMPFNSLPVHAELLGTESYGIIQWLSWMGP